MLLKRLFDIIASFLGGIILLPFTIIIALVIKVSSQGPIFFFQKRVGRRGKLFTCIKFRTMYVDSEKHGSITTSADSRITLVGTFLRKFKLDELPQLWNVFIGKMSFVGPRPDVPGYADKLEGEARKILELRPGITGPASIFFRREEELLAAQKDPQSYNDHVIWPAKVAINKIYLQEWGFWKDIGYVFITIVPVLDSIFHLMDRFVEFKPDPIPSFPESEKEL
jgi:lipopolysaccharide/colanic/teichoic acid biosynthesis glycosyltransferase